MKTPNLYLESGWTYTRHVLFPVCKSSTIISKMLNKDFFTHKEIRTLENLGFKITITAIPREYSTNEKRKNNSFKED